MNVNTPVEMPAQVFVTDELTITARMVRAGDLLHAPQKADDGSYFSAKVESARTGSSKRILKIEGKKTEVRLELDDEVLVRRVVETEESVLIRKAAMKEEAARKFVIGTRQSFGASKDRIAAAAATEFGPSTSDMEELMFARQLFRTVGWIIEAIERGNIVSFRDGLDKEIDEAKQRLISGHNLPHWSGGHSLHNAEKQVENEVDRKLANRLYYV